MKQVIVVGAGAAGIFAALAASSRGAGVQLFEKNDIVGKKMGITGKGRCNLTNTAPMTDFIARTPGHGKFLFSAYRAFSNEDLLRCVHQWGLATKEERGGRVFPCSDSAIEVRKLLYHRLQKQHVELHLNEGVLTVNHTDGGFAVRTEQGSYTADACIITTGGLSYPVTGSSGDGFHFAKKLGHTVTPLKPSLIPFTTEETWVRDLAGLSLRNVDVSLWKHGKKLASQFGEMLFTHTGVSGPVILMLSSQAAHKPKWEFPMQLRINLKPALTAETLDSRIQRDFQKYLRKQAGNGLQDLLPRRLIPYVLEQAEIPEQTLINQITRTQRQDLATVLQAFSLTLTGTRPIEEAIVTAGGVSVREINPGTMESKKVQGLYFAGEVIDIDAFTGGYNLQAAFSTGYVAGCSAAEEEADQ